MSVKKLVYLSIFLFGIYIISIFFAAKTLALSPMSAPVLGELFVCGQNRAVYYLGSNNRRYVFPEEYTYKSWFGDFSGVVSRGEEACFQNELGGVATMRPGSLIMFSSSSKVYAVSGPNTIRWVKSMEVASELFGPNWYNRSAGILSILPEYQFSHYRVGAPIERVEDYSRADELRRYIGLDSVIQT